MRERKLGVKEREGWAGQTGEREGWAGLGWAKGRGGGLGCVGERIHEEKIRGEREREASMRVMNKQLFFLLSFSYSELLEITVHCSSNSRIFSNSFFDVVGVGY